MDTFIAFFKEEQGATAVEYAIMAVAIAAVVVTIVFAIGLSVEDLFQTTNSAMDKG